MPNKTVTPFEQQNQYGKNPNATIIPQNGTNKIPQPFVDENPYTNSGDIMPSMDDLSAIAPSGMPSWLPYALGAALLYMLISKR